MRFVTAASLSVPQQSVGSTIIIQPHNGVVSLHTLMSLVEEEAREQLPIETECQGIDHSHVDDNESNGLHAAAARLQSVFRGYHIRRSLKVISCVGCLLLCILFSSVTPGD